MALMGVNRFLSQLEEESTYRKVVSVLLEGVAANALNLDPDAYQVFSRRIGHLRQAMSSDTTAESLLSHAAATVQAIEEYARTTNGLLHSQIEEMQDMLATLVHAPAAPVDQPEVAPQPAIGDGPGWTAAMQGVAILRARLRGSLDGIREEATQNAEPALPPPRPETARKPEPPHGPDLDPITELPCEAAARAQFLSALHSGEQRHVVVFVLASAQRINLRFGRVAGDEVVRELKRYVAGQLQPGDRMFRWPGPSIVALLGGAEPFERIRTRMKRFFEKSIEREFDINGRSVLIPLSIAWSVLPISLPLAGLNRQIHDFIAGQGYRDEDPIPN